MNQLKFKGHLTVKTDLDPTTSSKFKLEESISKDFTISEQTRWGYVRTDWTIVDEAAMRIALLLGNALRYDDIPLYIYCLRSGVRSHNLSITAGEDDRERLISFAEGLVHPIATNLISIQSKDGDILSVPNGRLYLDNSIYKKSDKDYTISVESTPLEKVRETKLDLIRSVFTDNDHFDIISIMNDLQSTEVTE